MRPFNVFLCAVGIAVASVPLGCKSSSTPAPVPHITAINGSADPATPVGVAVEITGSGFGAAPGAVRFVQSDDPANWVEVQPESTAWTDDAIVVVAPGSGGEGAFPVPGTLIVTVITSGGTSNAVELDVVSTPSFSVENVTWTTTVSLTSARTGLGATAIPDTDDTAYVIVAGGNDGSANLTLVESIALEPSGALSSAGWQAEASLPAARSYHAMVAAHPGNSPLSNSSDRYIYVIGGQQNAGDTPGGVNTVYRAKVNPGTGSVGTWSATSALPQSLIGASATIYNGHVYVVGGLKTDGTPSGAVYSARINTDGSLGAWARSPSDYPVPVSFATSFAFGAKLYVVAGDLLSSTDPSAQGTAGTKAVYGASISRGSVGTWAAMNEAIKQRKKHVIWVAFGQILLTEGVYEGGAGSMELERCKVLSDGTLDAWTGITALDKQISANVFGAAGVVSPIRVEGGAPRFLLFGGRRFVTSPPGALTDAVHYNDAP